jgi:hypothetical protein
MRTLTEQIIYQCEFCDKRFITKQGAKLHEHDYCYKSPIKKEKRRKEILACQHDWTTSWAPIFGEEHLKEPDYDYCFKCGVTDTDWRQIEKEIEGQ